MKIVIRWRPLALSGIAVLGLALRLYGLNWDAGNSFQPDERQIMFHVTVLAWPTSFAQFLDPVNSPLNPHFFAYGSFPMYLLAALGNILAHFNPQVDTFFNLTLVGRAINAIFDSGTILLTGWLALLLVDDETPGRRYAWNVALLAAGLVAFTPFQIQLSHFYAVDTMLLFFVVLTVLACVALVNTDKPIRWSLVAGVGYGLALATKFSAAPLFVPLFVAFMLRWYRRDFFSAFASLLLSCLIGLLTFVIAMPYALLDFQNFDLQVTEQGDLARGLLDYPYVRQFAGTTPYVYEGQNMLLWGLGLMLGLAACAGLLWLLWRVWRRSAGVWLVVLSWVIVYSIIIGSFYAKFMRYMLPVYPFLTLIAAAVLVAFARWAISYRTSHRQQTTDSDAISTDHEEVVSTGNGFASRLMPIMPALPILSYVAIAVVLIGTIFQGLALLNVYSVPNTRVQASLWIYSHVKPGSVLTYEQWDDPLPVAVGNNDPSIYQQATYTDNGQPTQGLDLYGDDTTQKAQWLANLLPNLNVITMATDRLDKSIPRLPFRYPLTIHYYQLLFSGQLGFHLAAEFQNRPNLFGITLDDSGADESYSVFDHPTVKIFVRDNPYPYTSDQLFYKLLQGVQLPPLGAQLSGAQHSLLLTPQQIADDQQSPPFGVQFPADNFSNAAPVFVWWLALTLLGLITFPLVFLAFRALRDRGYIFSKAIGILLLAYLAWILASQHILAFSFFSLLLVLLFLLVCSFAFALWQRQAIADYVREHWRLLVVEEVLFTLAFLLFVGIRSLNPDLWNPYLGGEKPMELAFLNAVLRSPYMPPYDPWFSGGYINYYYYGYVVIGSLIKLTGIVPTTAFNLAIPTLFALTFCGAFSVVYALSRRFSFALLGGYFAVVIGNLNGMLQFKDQIAAALAHMPIPAFDYWASSRVIPFTINEFPFWSFLFADLHPHVIDMPIEMLMLGIAAAILLTYNMVDGTVLERRVGNISLYALAAFIFGTIACINPWDMPAYGLILATVLLLRVIFEKWGEPKVELLLSLAFRVVFIGFLCGAGYLLYWPFYASYQELYVNGLGAVTQGTSISDYLTVFGLWLFIALTFFLTELYRWWATRRTAQERQGPATLRIAGYLLVCGLVLTVLALLGLKQLLLALMVLGVSLFVVFTLRDLRGEKKAFNPVRLFMYLLLLMGLGILLGQEIVYVRDFLDGGDYERMNTVFKFSMQAWLCLALGGALAVQQMWRNLAGIVRGIWAASLIVLVVGSSVFLTEGAAARINDHAEWIAIQKPVQSADYTPTLDGFAFANAWYPGDAQAIDWLNQHVAGSPVILEAAAPVSYQWYNRVSVYTGLPDVLGWLDHVGEQRYDYQPLNRISDVVTIYTTQDTAQAVELLRYYHVHYIYVGLLERQLYGQQSMAGLDKFDHMVGSALQIVYHTGGVTIYEVT